METINPERGNDMTNRITGDRLVDWIRWLVESKLMTHAEARDALAGIVDMKREQINDLKRSKETDR
jgi:hypothetical protein